MKKGGYLMIFLYCLTAGCLTGGTHGSIKDYTFSVPKNVLERTVLEVIAAFPNIERDTTIDHYNDGIRYVSIEIRSASETNDYTIMYYGNADYWSSSRNAEISLVYAFDEQGNGGSNTDGGIPWYKLGLRKRLLNLFERNFIDKLNQRLDEEEMKSKR